MNNIDLKKLKLYSLKQRRSKVNADEMGKAHCKGGTFGEFFSSLPSILGAASLKNVVAEVVKAFNANRPVVVAMGAHVIKCGLGPVIIDLLERRIITAIAMNGAGIIHDFELSFIGRTSEDVACELDSGQFGMAEETGRLLNEVIKAGVRKNAGIGESVGELINRESYEHKELSILAACQRLGVPATVHVAVGTDIIHMHPSASGAAIGEGSYTDFQKFCSVVSDLEGGVYFNIGSSVVLPEVFLKAVSICRNLGYALEEFTAVNMDFIENYRAITNVVKRPTQIRGRGYSLIGHHEIMLPLLAAGIIETIET